MTHDCNYKIVVNEAGIFLKCSCGKTWKTKRLERIEWKEVEQLRIKRKKEFELFVSPKETNV